MRTIIKRDEVGGKTALIQDILSEFNIAVPENKVSWQLLKITHKSGKLTNAEGGESWIDGSDLHVNLPYINLRLPKVG